MRNGAVGALLEADHGPAIDTDRGRTGHAIAGPYAVLEPGDYSVGFSIAALDLTGCGDDDVVAALDVCSDFGREIMAYDEITAGQLKDGTGFFRLGFSLDREASVEFRVCTRGNARLRIDEHRPLDRAEAGRAARAMPFPVMIAGSPMILAERERQLRHFFRLGFSLEIVGSDLVMSKDGIRFYVRGGDDLNLIEEIFVQQVYRFSLRRPAVVVDVGMNIGLVSMQFARNPKVRRIYAFEPFKPTFDRALENFSLNSRIADKIVPNMVGLSDVSGPLTIAVNETNDSGSRSILPMSSGGIVVDLQLQSAPEAIERIIAENEGDDIIVKIDCEGAEYAIFSALTAEGTLPKISAFMVEWHQAFSDLSKMDLIRPLIDAGFLVFDRSPPAGNGFFYAVRQ